MPASTSEERPMLDIIPQWFDEAAILEMRRQPPEVQADAYHKRVQDIEKSSKRNFTEIGFILVEMENSELYRYLPDPAAGTAYTSFDRWLCDVAPVSRSSAYAAKKIVQQLKDFVPRKELEGMPRANLEVLKELPPQQKRAKKWHAAAQEMTENDFRAKVERECPEAHIEAVKAIRVVPEKSGARVIERAIAARMEIYGEKGRAEALESIAVAFLDGDCDVEEYQGMTNGEAYRKAKGKAKAKAASAH